MSLWARAGLLGSVMCLLHRKKTVLTEVKQNCPSVGRDGHEYELKLVQVIYRHGARTPLKPIPHKEQVEWALAMLAAPDHTQFDYSVTDLVGGPKPPSLFEERYRSHTLKGGTFPGQLTTVGMEQMFNLGARLRRNYVEEQHFLSPVYKPSEVFVRSTNIVRNLESTRCLLAGLFQQQQEGPATIVTADANSEILYPNYHGCHELKQLTSTLTPGAAAQPGMADDLNQLRQEMNIDATKEVDFFLLLDNLLAQEVHGFPCPLKDKSNLQRIEERTINIFCYVIGPSNRKVLRLSVGPFLHTLRRNMLEARDTAGVATAQGRKLYLYAAHDVTLIPLLMALGIFNKKWPPYASDLTLELYQHRPSKEWFVRLNYNGEEQRVRGCQSGLCPLQEFLSALSEFALSPEDYKALCSVPGPEHI
ncbi:lysophosphatidic acid phosphatase type 6 [Xenopus tropicalis]|uniref:Lysophosphatidic acid phosphatase type 6 n=1 Tax=Xenopus tropicalis TaxID=8364 RepID=A0JM30_XENTR|eukprot:NP_001072736.1 lysophosphatidic acid phosphatase type 6 [Xenopus tropicalis]